MICRGQSKDSAYDKLIETGIKLFGKYGYDAVSTRQISKHANVNIAAVCYHFGGKKNFYDEVVRTLTNEITNFIAEFDIEYFETLTLTEAKTKLTELLIRYQNNFISEHGVNRLNIFMYEAFGGGNSSARNIYTNTLKCSYNFFKKIFTIYFIKAEKNLTLVDFSIALIHGIIQAYVITKKTISPPEINLGEDVLLQSIKTILD
jgi:AcrR family transcriptional regulator